MIDTRHARFWLHILLTAVLVATLAIADAIDSTPATAASDGELVVTGSGWGHGVGLSQYGAHALATTGSSAAEIMTHYYQGASMATLGKNGLAASAPLWVNLELDRSSLTLRVDAIVGAGQAVTIVRSGETWDAPVGSTIVVSGGTTCSMVITESNGSVTDIPAGECVIDFGWYDWSDPAAVSKTAVAIEGCTNADWNAIPTTFRECRYAYGQLHLRTGGGLMDLSNEMLMEDYILGISEMPYYWDGPGQAALEAQAIAARSYARELQIHRGTPGNNSCAAWCHVRDTTFDQRYVGWGHEMTAWVDATTATADLVMTHPDAPNGTIVRTYYSSSSGGATESIEEVWSGWTPTEYYTSVDDTAAIDGTVFNPNSSWTATLNAQTVANAVGLDYLKTAVVSKRNTSGSAHTLTFSDGVTTVTQTSAWFKANFGLKSITFDLDLTPGTPPAGGGGAPTFDDIAGNVHAGTILDIAVREITLGCNPPDNSLYCPARSISKGEMAAFLNRAFDYPATSKDFYTDDDGSIYEADINRMTAAGVVVDCAGGDYCVDQPVLRELMAFYLAQAFGYTTGGTDDAFVDDSASPYHWSINLIATVGVTKGCNPPTNDQFCPKREVRRDEMASFFDRALDLAGL